jgi:hypothetical protein
LPGEGLHFPYPDKWLNMPVNADGLLSAFDGFPFVGKKQFSNASRPVLNACLLSFS